MNFNVLEGGGGPPPPHSSPSSSSPASPRFLRVETIVRDHLAASRLTGDVCVVVFNELNGWSNASFAAWATNLGFTFSAFARSPHGYHLGLAAAGYEEEDAGRADARADATRPDGQAGAQAGAQASDRATLVEAVDGGAGSGTPFHHGLIWATVAGVDIIGTHLSPHSSEARLRETTAIVERLEMARATRRGGRRGRERERGAKKGEAGGGRLDEVAVEVGVDAATGATTAVGRRRAGRLGTGGSGDDALAIIVGDLNTLSPLDAARFVERRPGEDEASSNASLLLDTLRRTHRLRLKFLRPPPQVTDSTRGTSAASAASASAASAAAVTDTAGPVPDYRPMQALLDDGFIDLASEYAAAMKEGVLAEGLGVGARNTPREATGSAIARHTVPTAMSEDFMHAAELRLDYILVRGGHGVGEGEGGGEGDERQRWRFSIDDVHVRADDIANAASDHYPLSARLSFFEEDRGARGG